MHFSVSEDYVEDFDSIPDNFTNTTVPLDCPYSDDDFMEFVNKFSFWVEGVVQVTFCSW